MDKPCSSCEKEKHHRATFKSKQVSSIKKCLHLLHMDLFRPVNPRSTNYEKYTLVIVDEYSRSTIVKRHLKTPYEIFHGRIPNIDFLHVFGCPVYIHNHKDYLGKFDEKADDGYFLGYLLVSKTYHITFDESTDAIKFTKPSDDNITIAKAERYPPDEYLHPYEPSQRYQVNSNDVSFIEPYERLEHVVIETDGNPGVGMLTKAMSKELNFLSVEEPKKVSEALKHPGWVDAMQQELNQFSRNKVWILVPAPYGKNHNWL
ncbi:retrovirus-related pol polyprotein from transposon TNT 1-94 [Tanacetum coccineum]|uniref:Retrovirus-related pol polyprotein from transposon TNT 1-94 n=1 Tax=Tanacetum coccineum TaxID=301880 RepID=A0ABQ5GXT0_9ASTR